MSIRVEAVGRRLAAVGGVTGASIGTNAQDAYRAALLGLKEAQKKLTTDLAGKAADEILLSDRLAIEAARAEVARAATALTLENDELSPSTSSSATAAAADATAAPAATSGTGSASAKPAPAATRTSGVVDVYT
ncbi:hypothetical protein [Nocardioides sp. T2.26MG-1]|uniref:hypothetical protein n=1 Tax=Nocardioides sp. T2.26MG-1 TaxID=3041166 RepID=UPI0024777C75|nr:hypothetical protein [Nocardioides sp. T2.26MG-1]CAI9416155.1 hypothetical protein HIDPHFAB_02703 [Nocardioides sp. T2.26MG-1]